MTAISPTSFPQLVQCGVRFRANISRHRVRGDTYWERISGEGNMRVSTNMQMVGMIEKNGNNERKWEKRVTSWRDGVITELQ